MFILFYFASYDTHKRGTNIKQTNRSFTRILSDFVVTDAFSSGFLESRPAGIITISYFLK